MLKLENKDFPVVSKSLEDTVIHDIEQGSEKWHQLRIGRFTGSSCAKLIRGKKDTREKYIYDKACERVLGMRSDTDENANGIHINRGKMYEDVARNAYIQYGFDIFVEPVITMHGFIEAGEYLGYSPDGFVQEKDEEGIIEIKVPDSNNYFRQVLEIRKNGNKAIPQDYYIQMQFGLLICKKQWADYVLYNPKHEKTNKSLFIHRVYPDIKIQYKICNALEAGITQIEKLIGEYYDTF